MPDTTTLGRSWLTKTLIFTIVLLAFGTWGLADALYFYPRRGERHAARELTEHLEALDAAGNLTATNLTITDPKAELARLKARERDIAAAIKMGGPSGRTAMADQTRREWLESLALMWALRPEPRLVHTEKGPPTRKHYFDMREGKGYTVSGSGGRTDLDPRALKDLLVDAMKKTTPATPLSGFDMLFQWVFVVLGYGGGAWMLLTLVRAVSKKYHWDAATQTLTLHDGRKITPADIKEIDKRRWHKFFVTLVLNDGATYELDLLRYQPLEDWVLEMERIAFPEAAREADAEEEAASAGAKADSSSSNTETDSPNT